MDKSKRLLGTAGKQGCRYACIYCFTHDPDYKRPPLLDRKRPSEIISESQSIDVVQPACDTELFLIEDWKDYLDNLVSTGNIVSFATKAVASDDDIGFLKRINELLISRNSALHICVTIVRLNNWKDLEPNAPSPKERISFLRRLWEAGLGTCVAVRPMIPFLKDGELDELVSKTYRFCYGYLSGPLYLTKQLKTYMIGKNIKFKIEKRKAKWQTGEPMLDVIDSWDQEQYLAKLANNFDRQFFENNEIAAQYVCEQLINVPKKYPVWNQEIRRESVATLYIVDPSTKKFLLIYHRNLGAWLSPGGHVELNETLVDAALRETKEEVGITPKVVKLHGKLPREGKHFRNVNTSFESPAFCTVEEFIEPIGGHDPHIHVDSIIVGFADSKTHAAKCDPSEVTAFDWFSIEQIENNIDTFDNVPTICRAIITKIKKHSK